MGVDNNPPTSGASPLDIFLMEQTFVHRLTVGDLNNPKDLWSWMNYLSWRQPPNLALALRYDQTADSGLRISHSQRFMLRQEITAAIRQAWPAVLLNWQENNECILLLRIPYDADKRLILRKIQSWLMDHAFSLHVHIAIGLSQTVESSALLTPAIQCARNAANYAGTHGLSLYHAEDLESGLNPSPTEMEAEEGLETDIASVRKVLVTLQGYEADSLDGRKRVALDALVGLLNKCREHGLPADDELLNGTSLFNSLLQINTPQKLSLWIQQTGFTFLDRLAELVAQSRSHIISQAIQYIIGHLHEDLSLEIIAKSCSVSHYYLSHLFSKETGSTVTAFVRKSRMDRALWLLGNSEQSISDIACQVGFQDPNYFSKTFRAYMGKSPSAFRQSLG